MTDPRQFLLKLTDNLNALLEKEAGYNADPPLPLHNQIADHRTAIRLTEQHLAGDLTAAEWQAELQPLLLAVAPHEAAQTIVDLLSQYVADQGAALRQTVGEQAGAIVAELLAAVQAHLRQQPTGAMIVTEFEQDPDTFHKPLAKTLRQALETTADLTAVLQTLLTRYRDALVESAEPGSAAGNITISGTGSAAQGRGARAVTATGGSIAIGGNAGGNITMGGRNKDDE